MKVIDNAEYKRRKGGEQLILKSSAIASMFFRDHTEKVRKLVANYIEKRRTLDLTRI
jgi:alpha/beta superfamily hydrolase